MKNYKADQAYVWQCVQMLPDGKYTNDNFLYAYYEKPDKILFISEERILYIYEQTILWELSTKSLKLVERDMNKLVFYYTNGEQELIFTAEDKAIEVYENLTQMIK